MAKFKNPWGNNGAHFPTHVKEGVDRWFQNGGATKDEKSFSEAGSKSKKVVLFGGVDYNNEGEFGINLDIGNALAIANEPFGLGLGEGSVDVFNSPLFVNDFDTDIYKPLVEKIKKNFDIKTGILVLYGYSWGANILMSTLDKLQSDGINVALLLTIDGAKGPVSFSVKTTVPSNIKFNLNIYQTQLSNIGSHGYQNTGAKVTNVDLTGEKNSKGEAVVHSNIDDYTKLFSIQTIIYALTENNNFESLAASQIKDKIKLYDAKQK